MIATVLLSIVTAHAMDIVPKEGAKSIEVELSTDKTRVSFRLCDSTRTVKCNPLGPKKNYSVSALQGQRNWELAQIIGVSAAHIAVFLIGGLVGDAVYAGADMGIGSWELGRRITFGTLGGQIAISSFVKATSPAEQARQWRVISDEVLADKKVEIDSWLYLSADDRIQMLSESLVTVLSKMKD